MSSLTALFEQYPHARLFIAGFDYFQQRWRHPRCRLGYFWPESSQSLSRCRSGVSKRGKSICRTAAVFRPINLVAESTPVADFPSLATSCRTRFGSGSEFGYAVSALSDGAYVDEFFLNDNKVDIFLFSLAGNQQSLSQLALAPIVTPKGNVLPPQALADISEQMDSDSLRRVDGRRTVTLYIIPPRAIALETAVAKVREELSHPLSTRGGRQRCQFGYFRRSRSARSDESGTLWQFSGRRVDHLLVISRNF